MRPVEIVGGGLAGLGLGIALRGHGVPVTIHEAGHYPRHRVCGEFITSLDDETQKALRLERVLCGALRAHGVTWHEDSKADITHRLPHPALCLSRHRLDACMADTFSDLGGELRTGSRVACEDRPGRVMACGRLPDASSPWVGIKQHYRELEAFNDLEVHFSPAGYIGLARVDGQTTNVCGLLRRGSCDLRASFHEIAAAAGFRDLGRRLATAQPVRDSFCAVAALDYKRPAISDDSLRVGDRSALIPPFTGHGMTIALQSSTTVVPSLLAWSRGEARWEQAKSAAARRQRRRFASRIRAARTLHPFLLDARARHLARTLHRRGLLPVGLMYRLMHR